MFPHNDAEELVDLADTYLCTCRAPSWCLQHLGLQDNSAVRGCERVSHHIADMVVYRMDMRSQFADLSQAACDDPGDDERGAGTFHSAGLEESEQRVVQWAAADYFRQAVGQRYWLVLRDSGAAGSSFTSISSAMSTFPVGESFGALELRGRRRRQVHLAVEAKACFGRGKSQEGQGCQKGQSV